MSGKASLEMFVHSNGGAQHRGILFSDPIDGWIEQRKFALKTLKYFGVGHRDMDQHLQLNLQDLIDHFKYVFRLQAIQFDVILINICTCILLQKFQ